MPVAGAPASLLKVDLTSPADGHYQISYLTVVIQTHPFACPLGCADEAEVTSWILFVDFILFHGHQCCLFDGLSGFLKYIFNFHQRQIWGEVIHLTLFNGPQVSCHGYCVCT